ncbi:MAG: helix-turn-helix domain-containing protein [Pseudomonadota bacterium]
MTGVVLQGKISTLLLDRRGVETHYGITKRYLEVAAVRGDGPPYIKIGRSVRYRTSDIDAWLDDQRVQTAPPMNH